ncbi:hypothetical protein niasHT_035624 [Heterodera trifolii]|uniref:Carboxylic ester hydrolase n=1 Tax=Heterodera trifolii TaxID=157864 RepID=A0ABD2I6C2_9BILA
MRSKNHFGFFFSLFFVILTANSVKLERKKVVEGYAVKSDWSQQQQMALPISFGGDGAMGDEFGTCAIDQMPTLVHTMFGPVKGFTDIDGANSSLVDVFLGIPFAQPPVGHLRFEAKTTFRTLILIAISLLCQRNQKICSEAACPRDALGRHDGTEHRKSCVPHARPDWQNELLGQDSFSEDCLYLNIFAPHGANKGSEEQLLPVLILIHGGAFSIGSSRQFGDHRDIGAKFVSHGIVVVAIQYRLGVFGFASSGDAQMPGNFGLWDQVAALQFIRQNIRRFGGNPEDITLLGHSAGAASVSALAISPHSRHLFQRAIQMAGSVFSSFLLGAHVHRLTLGLVETLDCEEPPKECLKRKNVDEIHAAVERMGPAKVRLGPRIDGDFFPHDIPSLVDTSPKKPTLIGFTDLEALQFTLLHGKNSTIMAMAVPWSETDNYGPEQFEGFLLGQIATTDRLGSRAHAVGREIFNFYTKSSAALAYSTNAFYLRQYTQLISDLAFNLPIITELQHKSSRGWPIHFYIHGHVNEQSFPREVPIHESFHGNDLMSIFNGSLRQFPFNEQDKQIEQFMAEAFRRFVKSGNPSTSESFRVNWPRVSCPRQLEYLRIVHPPTLLANIDREMMKRISFWRAVSKKHSEFNFM